MTHNATTMAMLCEETETAALFKEIEDNLSLSLPLSLLHSTSRFEAQQHSFDPRPPRKDC